MITPIHIQSNDALSPAFGTYALPPSRESWRDRAAKAGLGKIGRWYISLCRKRALHNLTPPFDVEIIPTLKARLYPKGNRCEKRAVAGVQIWDGEERAFMQDAIKQSRENFIFIDVGANVGLYSLFAAFYARQAKTNIHIHAIEPDAENARRLMDNARVNDFSLTLWPAAISDEDGTSSLQSHPDNRGEIKLGQTADGKTIPVTTLAQIINQSALEKINLLKLDIEGHDLRALTHLFENLNSSLYPKHLIIETGTPDDIALTTLCYNKGYVVKGRGRLNLMLMRDN